MGFIFKYKQLNDYTFDSLFKSTINYTTANEFNDPFDSSFSYSIDTIYKILIEDKEFMNDLANIRLYQELKRMPSDVEINEYLNSINSNYYYNNMLMVLDFYCKEALAFVRSEYLISCFSKTYDNQALWAYYADNGKGIVVEYEKENIEFVSEKNSRRYSKQSDLCNKSIEVEYVSRLNEKNSSMINLLKEYFSYLSKNINKRDTKYRYEFLTDDFYDIFFKKLDKWSIESEYRIIIPNNDLNQKRKNLKINKIKAIYLGTNVCDWHKEVLKLFCMNYSIELYQMTSSYNTMYLGLIPQKVEL